MIESIGTLTNQLDKPVCSMFISHANARKHYSRIHKHTEFEISLVLDGSGLYSTMHGTEAIEGGDIFIFSSNEQHCITDIDDTAGENSMNLLNIHFSPIFVWGADSDNPLTCEYQHMLFDKESLSHNKLDRNNPHYPKIVTLISEIRNEFSDGNADYPILVKNKLVEILITLKRFFSAKTASHPEVVLQEKLIQRIEDAANFISINYSKELSLAQIADQAYLSAPYFSSIFKKIYGMSPWEYLTIQRIDRAKLLLKTTDDNILDIAVKCGFNNSANFNKLFRKYTNTTPSNYRK